MVWPLAVWLFALSKTCCPYAQVATAKRGKSLAKARPTCEPMGTSRVWDRIGMLLADSCSTIPRRRESRVKKRGDYLFFGEIMSLEHKQSARVEAPKLPDPHFANWA
jgi:hypothetical protein